MVTPAYLHSANGTRLGSSRAIGEEKEKEGLTVRRKKPRLCIVTWRDILSCAGWEKEGEVECPQIQSVGWFISQTKDTIKIASTLDPNDSIGAKGEANSFYGVTAFHKGCVESIDYFCQ